MEFLLPPKELRRASIWFVLVSAGVPHFRASTIFLRNIQKYVTKKVYLASCARQFPANKYSSFQETHKRLRRRGLRPRPSYYMVVSHKPINLTLVFRSRMTVASSSARLQVQRDNRGILYKNIYMLRYTPKLPAFPHFCVIKCSSI